MHKLLTIVAILTGLLVSQTAAADSRDHRWGYNSHRYSSHSYNRHFGDSRRYRSRHYSANSYHYPRSRGFSFGYSNRSHRRHDNDAGLFVGGLVLGSLLSYPRRSEPERVVYRRAPAVRSETVVSVRSPTTSRNRVASGRSLLRDLEGNCFERVIDEQGNEIRVQLDASECSF